jgi:Tfp pilus assembly protein PilF
MEAQRTGPIAPPAIPRQVANMTRRAAATAWAARIASLLVAAAGAAGAPPPASAQVISPSALAARDSMPPRPRLGAADADTNEARNYVYHGRTLLERDPAAAEVALRWATRLDPTLAAPYLLRWDALWRSKPKLLRKYAKGDKKVLATGEGQRIDSLYLRAMMRDPCVMLSPEVTGRAPPSSSFIRGMVTRRPKSVGLRILHACNFYQRGDHDSTLAQLNQALALIGSREAESVRPVYESKAMFHYLIGKAYAGKGDMNAAREAFGRALGENLAFYPAHSAIASIAWTNMEDTATALQEFELALQLSSADGVLRYNYGTVLLDAGRNAEAAEQLAKAIELEPYFANSYFNLALALARAGRAAEARPYYQAFIARAPKSLQTQIDMAKQSVNDR